MFARVRLNVAITTELKTRMWYTARIMKKRINVLTVMPVVIRYKVRRFAKNRHITFFAALMALLASSVSCAKANEGNSAQLSEGSTVWFDRVRKLAKVTPRCARRENRRAEHAKNQQA